jgi:hypothetical protein
MAEAEVNLYDEFVEFFGQEMGNARYSVYRPDYTQITTPNYRILNCVWMRVDPNYDYAEFRMLGAAYFSIFAPRTLLPGDIIKQTNPDNIAVNQITLQNTDNVKECVGFATNYTGELSTSSSDTPYFTNVLFDYAEIETPDIVIKGSSEFEGATLEKKKTVILFLRAGVKIGHYFHDIADNQWYRIQNISFHNYSMELDLEVVG